MPPTAVVRRRVGRFRFRLAREQAGKVEEWRWRPAHRHGGLAGVAWCGRPVGLAQGCGLDVAEVRRPRFDEVHLVHFQVA